ncbi:hypothetical protein PR048_019726 [Dryococelus australis]|uniref:Uncharacterized protein n=1 Tax=Dryococelus australis TaxID=614101 RepID=A0ABQ9H493_9NEOP|nr:hypothetical protein PR048_019726 [Dryococelus australis]
MIDDSLIIEPQSTNWRCALIVVMNGTTFGHGLVAGVTRIDISINRRSLRNTPCSPFVAAEKGPMHNTAAAGLRAALPIVLSSFVNLHIVYPSAKHAKLNIGKDPGPAASVTGALLEGVMLGKVGRREYCVRQSRPCNIARECSVRGMNPDIANPEMGLLHLRALAARFVICNTRAYVLRELKTPQALCARDSALKEIFRITVKCHYDPRFIRASFVPLGRRRYSVPEPGLEGGREETEPERYQEPLAWLEIVEGGDCERLPAKRGRQTVIAGFLIGQQRGTCCWTNERRKKIGGVGGAMIEGMTMGHFTGMASKVDNYVPSHSKRTSSDPAEVVTRAENVFGRGQSGTECDRPDDSPQMHEMLRMYLLSAKHYARGEKLESEAAHGHASNSEQHFTGRMLHPDYNMGSIEITASPNQLMYLSGGYDIFRDIRAIVGERLIVYIIRRAITVAFQLGGVCLKPNKVIDNGKEFRRSWHILNDPMRMIEVVLKQSRNERAGDMGAPRENPLTNGIIRHDSHMRKSGVTQQGIESRRAGDLATKCELETPPFDLRLSIMLFQHLLNQILICKPCRQDLLCIETSTDGNIIQILDLLFLVWQIRMRPIVPICLYITIPGEPRYQRGPDCSLVPGRRRGGHSGPSSGVKQFPVRSSQPPCVEGNSSYHSNRGITSAMNNPQVPWKLSGSAGRSVRPNMRFSLVSDHRVGLVLVVVNSVCWLCDGKALGVWIEPRPNDTLGF